MGELADIVHQSVGYAFTTVFPFWAAWKCFDVAYAVVHGRLRKPVSV